MSESARRDGDDGGDLAELALRERIDAEIKAAMRELDAPDSGAQRIRGRVLLRLLRAHVASVLLDDLAGHGELLTKEIRELRREPEEDRVIREELKLLVVDVLQGRSCCIPSSGGACLGCGYPRAYAHPDCVDAAFGVDAIYVGGSAVEVTGDSSIPRGVVRVVQGDARGFEYVDHPIPDSPACGPDGPGGRATESSG